LADWVVDANGGNFNFVTAGYAGYIDRRDPGRSKLNGA